jgi:predicted TPR repeat methyltransferase
VSVGPPEGKGTISLTGLSGQASRACADTIVGVNNTAAVVNINRRLKFFNTVNSPAHASFSLITSNRFAVTKSYSQKTVMSTGAMSGNFTMLK